MKTSERLSNAEKVSESFLKGFEKITSKDSLRPVMNGVYFDKGRAVATDSYKLVQVSMELYGLENVNLLDGYFMDNEVLSECKVKKGQKIYLETGKVLFVSGSSFKIIKTLELQLMEEIGKYPNYEAVTPRENMPIDNFGLNGKFLTDIQNVYTLSGKGDGEKLTINTHGENRALTICDSDGFFTGLLMPITVK